MLSLGLSCLKLQTKFSIALFALICLVINSYLLYVTIRDKVYDFDIEQPQTLMYVITLVVRFLAGVITDVGLLVGVYFGMKALIIVTVMWKATGGLFDMAHGATYFPKVSDQVYKVVDQAFKSDVANLEFEETGLFTLYVFLALLMGYGTYRVNVYYRGLYIEDAKMTTILTTETK